MKSTEDSVVIPVFEITILVYVSRLAHGMAVSLVARGKYIMLI